LMCPNCKEEYTTPGYDIASGEEVCPHCGLLLPQPSYIFPKRTHVELGRISFDRKGDSPSGKTQLWMVVGSDESTLGIVKWYAPWRQYCFLPLLLVDYLVFSSSCLINLAKFMRDLTERHKKKRTF